MKLILFLFILSISQLWATESYSQMTKLTLKLEDVKISDALKDIENQSEFFFLYSPKLIDVERKVNIDAENETIKDILSNLFKEKIKFAVYDRQIILTSNEQSVIFSVLQQQKQITGIVTDKDGAPLPGVNVVVTGTTQGTTTDIAGKYSIDIPQGGKSLTFTFIGFEIQQVTIGTLTQINVTMAESAVGLGEVVVIGYGTSKKSDITGSLSSLTSDNFNSGVVLAPEQLLQGKVSGVTITLNSGEPGANSKVRVRGGTSINAGNDPLYVIDGVPVGFDAGNFIGASEGMTTLTNNPLNMLNPSDIESINILKDASATAIYGSRGANGVIIITTKKGKAGKSSIEYEGSMGVSSIREKIDMLTADEFRKYMSDNSDKITNWVDGGANTDWQDEIFRTAIMHSHNLALSGGSENTNYRASVNYTNQEGIIIASDLEKVTGRININHKAFNDKLNIGMFLTNAMLKNHSAPSPEGYGSDISGGIIRDALRNDPTYPVKDATGAYIWHGILNQNPVETTDLRNDETETYRYMGNLTLDYKFTNYLSFNTNIGFTKENVDRMIYLPNASRLGSSSHGNASHQFRNNYSKLIETNLVFNKIFGKHSINALAGYSYQEFINTGAFMQSLNFITDATTYNNIGGGDKNSYYISTYKNSHKLISFYGRATYDFDKRYLLTVTVRQDGSTRFGANNKWGTFPSAAIAWRLSEEEFMKSISLISNLKLRVGYGITGNQEIGDYISLPTLSAGGNTYIIGGIRYTAVGANQYHNPDLKWESTAQTNLGLDFGIIRNRLTGSLDLYKKTTSDLLLSFSVPSPAVVTSTTANVGKVENKGIELELNGVILAEGPLGWEAYANLTHNVNKVVSLSNDTWKQEQIYTGWLRVPGFTGVSPQIIKAGLPLGTFYGYKYIGVDENGKQQFEDVSGHDANGKPDGIPDGQILPGDDRMVIGNSQPDFTYGFGSKLTYKRFNLDLFFRGVQGVTVVNSTLLDMADKTKMYWPLGDNARVNVAKDALTDGLAYDERIFYSSKWIQDASFLRLENATLNYNFNVSSLKWLSNLNIYVTGQNLFVITKYKGFDPEVSDGIDAMNYPRPRTVMMGVKVQF